MALRPKGFAYLRRFVQSPLWHIGPVEYSQGVLRYFTLCGYKYEVEIATVFQRHVAVLGGIVCRRCLEEFQLARSTVEQMLAEQQPTIEGESHARQKANPRGRFRP